MSSGFFDHCRLILSREISRVARYFSETVHVDRLPFDNGALAAQITTPQLTTTTREALAQGNDLSHRLLFINGNFNHSDDIQAELTEITKQMGRSDRVLVLLYNPYNAPLYALLHRLGLRKTPQPTTFPTRASLSGLAKLAGLELVSLRPVLQVPLALGGLENILAGALATLPGVRWIGSAALAMFRPVQKSSTPPTLSVLIPARNERGTIRAALDRLPITSCAIREVLFVEGNSTDGTWDEIQHVIATHELRTTVSLKAFKQEGKGKGDAVRLGFAHATSDLVAILDADLTMPPELLPRFYDAYCSGAGDFVNGSRLLYPMEGAAMKPLNLLGNIFFSKALSFVLATPLSDTLCGTKLLRRDDYHRFVAWRKDFGEFDPFGDFDLLFPAAELGLGIVDVPVKYRDRTYGTTNIHRFRHGFMLLRMTAVGLVRMRAGIRA
jgi:hypothetical protein